MMTTKSSLCPSSRDQKPHDNKIVRRHNIQDSACKTQSWRLSACPKIDYRLANQEIMALVIYHLQWRRRVIMGALHR